MENIIQSVHWTATIRRLETYLRVVDTLTQEIVFSGEVTAHAEFIKHPTVEKYLEKVVAHKDPAEIECLSVLHEPWAEKSDEVVVDTDNNESPYIGHR